MKKVDSYDELKELIGIDNINFLREQYSSIKEEFRNDRIVQILGGNVDNETEFGIYTINGRDFVAVKPPNEGVIYIPI